MPGSVRSRTMCSIIGTLAIGIIGFGWLLVSGRRRVPSPPARITAFILRPPPPFVTFGLRATRDRYVLGRGVVPQDDAADCKSPRAHRERRVPRRSGRVEAEEHRQGEH